MALVASLRLETFDSSLWERNSTINTYKTAFVFLVVIAIVGIFFYWEQKVTTKPNIGVDSDAANNAAQVTPRTVALRRTDEGENGIGRAKNGSF